MGGYFSLRGPTEWDGVIAETPTPSIWSTVIFSPLARAQHMLLDRPGRVSFSYPGAVKQGGDFIKFSEATDINLLVGYDAEAGRFYTALLLSAHDGFPHKYSRTVEEVSVQVPSNKVPKDSMMMSTVNGGATRSTMGASPKSSGLSLEQFGETGEPPPSQESYWPYCLLYAVKEGVIVHVSEDVESCEEIVRSVAVRYRDAQGAPPPVAHSLPEVTPSSAHPQIYCVKKHIGHAPNVCGRILANLLEAELRRDFQVHCPLDKQDDYTNCTVFCIRVMMAMQLGLRGYDVLKVCESVPTIGSKAGHAAKEQWERLWRQVRA